VTVPRIARRAVLLGGAALATARAETVLRVGDQRGNQRAVMPPCADVLDSRLLVALIRAALP